MQNEEDSPLHLKDDQSIRSEDQGSASEISIGVRTNSGFSDLDILPTKDYPERSMFDNRESISSCSHYNDSKISSQSLSPIHNPRTFHSDSEATPKKFSMPLSSTNDRHDWSSLDVEDLPLKLQRCVESAFAEMDKARESETVVMSPSHRRIVAEASVLSHDPGC
ncbi:hypothetical protein JTE90_009539 [Oedothorax gibbosus]|uniref:Uncharacterized protein n=1 Tax=Oedothorax gibbosus TaxID=931172 RepID=A0AAV6USK7_9ARAC|nr:hypothetical protein JTE90_009539 [Oedothorax gibbosus]